MVFKRISALSLLAASISLSGCFGTNSDSLFGEEDPHASTKTDPAAVRASYNGCIQGSALGIDRIMVEYEFPAEAEKFTLYRDGMPVFSTTDHSVTSRADWGLAEGTTYHYSCEITVDGIAQVGKVELDRTTKSFRAPDFAGLHELSQVDATTMRVEWRPPEATGAPADYYKIYIHPGITMPGNWEDALIKQLVPAGQFAENITGLGGEMAYTVGVRACTLENRCDSNTRDSNDPLVTAPFKPFRLNLAIAPRPAPTPLTAYIKDTKIWVEVQWDHTFGAIGTRNIYYYKRNLGDPDTAPVPTYSSAGTMTVADPYNPTTKFELPIALDPALDSGKDFYIFIQDVSRLGQKAYSAFNAAANRLPAHAKVSVIDITRPLFGAPITAGVLEKATQTAVVEDTIAVAFVPATPAQGVDHYIARVLKNPSVATEACTAADTNANLKIYPPKPATDYPYNDAFTKRVMKLTGLQAKTRYAVCLKAVDAYGNSSAANVADDIMTLDSTPPVFTGLQEFFYNNGSIYLRWYPSPDPMLKKYTLTMRRTQQDAGETPVFGNTTIDVLPAELSAPDPDTGLVELVIPKARAIFGDGQAFDDYENVYAIVNAWDRADELPGPGIGVLSTWIKDGTWDIADKATPSNGTTLTAAKKAVIPDSEKPQGFAGIVGFSKPATMPNGRITVYWNEPAPADLTDYAGYYIYTVGAGGELTQVKDCFCGTGGCANFKSGCTVADVPDPAMNCCTVTGLGVNKTYKFHVRPYDAVRNIADESRGLDPAIEGDPNSVIPAPTKIGQTNDRLAPSFNGNMSLTKGSGKVIVAFDAAEDDQEEGTIIYDVYRRPLVTFDQIPPVDPAQKIASAITSSPFDDTTVVGGLYYYTICATDASGNESCDGNVVAIDIDDTTEPVIDVNSIVSEKTGNEALKKWSLRFNVKDTPGGNLHIYIYQQRADAPGPVTELTDSAHRNDGFNLNGSTDWVLYNMATAAHGATSVGGDPNTKGYMNYKILAVDAAGNTGQADFSVYFDNTVEVRRVRRSSGNLSNQLLYIHGHGFSDVANNGLTKSTEILIGEPGMEVPCEIERIFDTRNLSCRVTEYSSTPGAQLHVTAINPDSPLSQALATNAFTYTTGHICDNPGSWDGPDSNGDLIPDFATGNGSAAIPYKICTKQHLQSIDEGVYYGANFEIIDNIDLQNSFSPIGTILGTLNGGDHLIHNWTLSSSAIPNLGVFGQQEWQAVTIKNIALGNIHLTNSHASGRTGIFIGSAAGSDLVLDNIHAFGCTASGVNMVGGLFGWLQASGVSNSTSNVNVATTINGGGIVAVGFATSILGCAAYGQVSAATSGSTGSVMYLGGLAGNVGSVTIERSYAAGNVVFPGGMTCTHATSCTVYMGGLLGGSQVTTLTRITDSYSSGDIIKVIAPPKFLDWHMGGIIGWAYNSGGAMAISRSFAFGKIPVGGGGIAGKTDYASLGADSFWNASANPGLPGKVSGIGSVAAIGLTETEIRDGFNPIYDTWDFDGVDAVWQWLTTPAAYPSLR